MWAVTRGEGVQLKRPSVELIADSNITFAAHILELSIG